MASTAGRPMYRDIADDLRIKITNGTYPVGSSLPSTSKLMEDYDVSITVARAAVKELQTEGIAVGQPGKGVFVQHRPDPPAPSTDYTELMQQIAALREALAEAVQDLDQRLSALERKTQPARRSRRSDS